MFNLTWTNIILSIHKLDTYFNIKLTLIYGLKINIHCTIFI